jgi:arabinofuranosyltransferase
LPIIIFGYLGWDRRWIGDDGFINIRIANNLISGFGPVFNIDERVEAGTSPLWIFLIALPGYVGLRIETWIVVQGIVYSMLGLALALLSSLRFDGITNYRKALSQGVFPLGILAYVALPVTWDFVTSGLENCTSLLWIGASAFFLSHLEGRQPKCLSKLALLGFWISLGPLVRPELSILTFGYIALVSLWIGRIYSQKKPLFLFLTMALFIPLAWQIFRMGFFGILTPNTAVSKAGLDSRWNQGMYFFRNFFGFYHLGIPFLIAFVFLGWRTRLSWGKEKLTTLMRVWPLFYGIFHIVYVVKVGGGFMHGRMFLPDWFCCLIPVAAVPWFTKNMKNTKTVIHSTQRILISIFTLWATLILLFAEMTDREWGIENERMWYVKASGKSNPVFLEDYQNFTWFKGATSLLNRSKKGCPETSSNLVKKNTPFVLVDNRKYYGPLQSKKTCFDSDQKRIGPTINMIVLRSAIGLTSNITQDSIHLVDNIGLSDPLGARIEISERKRPGHERYLSNVWYVARFALPDPSDGPKVKIAREALHCGELAQLLDSVEGKITWEKFWLNFTRSFQNQALKIPREPKKAQQKFCQR